MTIGEDSRLPGTLKLCIQPLKANLESPGESGCFANFSRLMIGVSRECLEFHEGALFEPVQFAILIYFWKDLSQLCNPSKLQNTLHPKYLSAARSYAAVRPRVSHCRTAGPTVRLPMWKSFAEM